MNVRNNLWSRTIFTSLTMGISLSLGIAIGIGQTFDFGYVPVGGTNRANGFNFRGGSYNGTNIVMTAEMFDGANADDFVMSTNYVEQTLLPGQFYFY